MKLLPNHRAHDAQHLIQRWRVLAAHLFLVLLCALVLVVQLIPAMMTLYGMLKSIGSKEKSPARARTH